MEKDYKGIIVPLVTPLNSEGGLDTEGLAKLVEHVIEGGVTGIFILGTSGEGPSLSKALQKELIKQASQFIKGRVKFLVGVTDTSLQETVRLTREAVNYGADAVVVAPPPYYPLSNKELLRYIKFLAQNSPVPLFLYNIPVMVKTRIEADIILSLMDEPNIIGLKDSSKDIGYFKQAAIIVKQRQDWSLLTGYEVLLTESMKSGGDGGVLAGANIFPDTLVSLYNAVVANNAERIAEIEELLSVRREIYTLGQGILSSVQAIKCALQIKGICGSRMTYPFTGLNEESRQRLEKIIRLTQK